MMKGISVFAGGNVFFFFKYTVKILGIGKTALFCDCFYCLILICQKIFCGGNSGMVDIMCQTVASIFLNKLVR